MQNYSVPLIGLPGKQTGVKYCNDEKTVKSKLKYLSFNQQIFIVHLLCDMQSRNRAINKTHLCLPEAYILLPESDNNNNNNNKYLALAGALC